MKKIISYLLFLVVTTAYCVESASMLIKVLKEDVTVCMDDNDCEKEDAEREKSMQKEEKVYLPHESNTFNHLAVELAIQHSFGHPKDASFSSSDHSQMIDSPPDMC